VAVFREQGMCHWRLLRRQVEPDLMLPFLGRDALVTFAMRLRTLLLIRFHPFRFNPTQQLRQH
jgi:hypothetical protein